MRRLPVVSPRRVALIFALFCGSLILYVPTLHRPPIWDDHTFVFGQPFLRDCGNLRRVVSLESVRSVLRVRGAARPVWLASVLVDTCIAGGRIEAYHVTSAFWHGLGALLLVLLAWRLTGDERVALAAGVFFAVHPLHVEPVSIITFRTDLLCLAFMLICILFHRESVRSSGRKAAACLAASLAAAALAMLSKEVAVVLPLLLLATDSLFAPETREPARRNARAGVAACVALVALYLVFRAPRSGYVMPSGSDAFSELNQRVEFSFARAGGDGTGAVPKPLGDPPWRQVYVDPGARARTMSRIFGSYLRRLIWPWPLQGDYAPQVITSWLHPGVLAAWVAWLGLFAAAWRWRRRIPLASYGLFWTGATLLPVCGLVVIFNLEADRYLYIPSAGVCLAAAALLGAAMRSHARAATTAAVLTALAGAVLVERRLADFRSDETFYRATLAVDPDVPRAHLALAMVCANEGRSDCAEEECRETLRLWPGYVKARKFCGAPDASSRPEP